MMRMMQVEAAQPNTTAVVTPAASREETTTTTNNAWLDRLLRGERLSESEWHRLGTTHEQKVRLLMVTSSEVKKRLVGTYTLHIYSISPCSILSFF